MQLLKFSGAVRPLKWSLGVKWLMCRKTRTHNYAYNYTHTFSFFVTCMEVAVARMLPK